MRSPFSSLHRSVHLRVVRASVPARQYQQELPTSKISSEKSPLCVAGSFYVFRRFETTGSGSVELELCLSSCSCVAVGERQTLQRVAAAVWSSRCASVRKIQTRNSIEGSGQSYVMHTFLFSLQSAVKVSASWFRNIQRQLGARIVPQTERYKPAIP